MDTTERRLAGDTATNQRPEVSVTTLEEPVRKTRALVGALLGLGLALSVPIPSSAKAADSRTEPSLSGQNQAIVDIQRQVRAKKLTGYTGMSIDTKTGALDVYWSEQSRGDLSRLAIPRAGVATRLHYVPYSAEQIWQQSRDLITAAKGRGIPVEGVGSSTDFSGLRVNVDDAVTPAQIAELRSLGAIEVESRGRSVPLTARNNDSGPFSGGAAIVSGSQKCSLGFSAQMATGSIIGISALHCGSGNNWTTPTGTTVGTSGYYNLGTDTMVIYNPTYGNFASSVYINGWNSSVAQTVSSKADPVLNELVCADGGYTGEVCGATVTEVNYTDSRYVGPGYLAVLYGGATFAAPGDSGSPGYAKDANGNIIAGGILSSALESYKTYCLTYPYGNPGDTDQYHCYFGAFFVYQGAVEDNLYVTILTG